MTIQTQISDTLTSAKDYAGDWMAEIVVNERNGLDQCCELRELALYTEWINLLQDYYNKAYLGAAYYGFRYINEQQAILLMARINSRDFKRQTSITWSPSGDHNNDFNDDFSIS